MLIQKTYPGKAKSKITSDPELNYLVLKLSEVTGRRWIYDEVEHTRRSWWWFGKPRIYHTCYLVRLYPNHDTKGEFMIKHHSRGLTKHYIASYINAWNENIKLGGTTHAD